MFEYDAPVTDLSFLTHHAVVLLCVAKDPQMRLRDIAAYVGVTERAAHRIVSELADAGYLSRTRQGNRSHYEVHPDRPFRHPFRDDYRVGELLSVLLEKPRRKPQSAAE
jgi:hypothetical protein